MANAPKILLFILVGLLTGISGYTFHFAEGFSYLTDDPRACVNCHVMRDQYESWQKASHHAVAVCNDCHVPQEPLARLGAKLRNGYAHSQAFTLMDFHEPIRIREVNRRIVNDNCVRCHSALVAEILPHKGAADPSWNCIQCHTASGHGPPR